MKADYVVFIFIYYKSLEQLRSTKQEENIDTKNEKSKKIYQCSKYLK